MRLSRFCWTSSVVLWYAAVFPLIIANANASPRHFQDDIPREEAAYQEHRSRPKGDLG